MGKFILKGMKAAWRLCARVLALAKEHQWTAGIEKYKKREVLSTRGLSGWWALAILRSAKRAWALTREWALAWV